MNKAEILVLLNILSNLEYFRILNFKIFLFIKTYITFYL